MNLLELNLRIVGVLLILLGAAHAFFEKRFRWKEELAGISEFTREVHFVHNAYIGLTVALNGLLCLLLADDLVRPSHLALALLLAMTIFWGSRLVIQLFVYSSSLWRGKQFETRVHIAFVLFWMYVTGVSVWGAYSQLQTSQ